MNVLTIAWNRALIEGILQKVEEKTDIKFYHFVYRETYLQLERDEHYKDRLFLIPDENEFKSCTQDLNLLKEIERYGDFTINNLILSDRVLKHLKTDDALTYCTMQASAIIDVMAKLKPDYVIGSWDTVLPGLAYLICKKNKIPFYVLKFSVIPANHLNICEYPTPIKELAWFEPEPLEVIEHAKEVLDKWLNRDIISAAYVSTTSISDIIKKVPFHARELFQRAHSSAKFGKNRFRDYSLVKMIGQYIRKKSNVIFRNKGLFITEIPREPFFFYGFHMQPESSIDVWAPFYSNQFHVVESIARSMPVGRKLCLKIHISDADSYSNSELRRYLKIPNVKIVSPSVSSRGFIENAEMIFTIQGTIGLEGALLGKPVIYFGDSTVLKFSSVSKLGLLDALPQLVKEKLKESTPSRERVVRDYADYLKYFLPCSTSDWYNGMALGLTDDEVVNYISIFNLIGQFDMYPD